MKRLLLLVGLICVLLVPGATRGQTGSRAGLVVLFSDGSVQSSCVPFEGESITSLELLQRSGLDVIAQVSGNNAAVCKIGGDGCDYPAETCFCRFGSGQQGEYWAFWRQIGGAWQYSAQGAGSVRVRDRDVDGWAWGTGNVQSGAQPPPLTFDQICPAVAAPTSEPPTAEPPRPTFAPTDVPTARPTVRPTPRPTLAPASEPAQAAPTSAPEPTQVAPTIVPSVTAQPTATVPPQAPTGAPSLAAASIGSTSAAPTPTQAIAGAANAQRPRTSVAGYVVFGAMLALIVGGILFVQRRRAR